MRTLIVTASRLAIPAESDPLLNGRVPTEWVGKSTPFIDQETEVLNGEDAVRIVISLVPFA